jgi:hypothetical protein
MTTHNHERREWSAQKPTSEYKKTNASNHPRFTQLGTQFIHLDFQGCDILVQLIDFFVVRSLSVDAPTTERAGELMVISLEFFETLADLFCLHRELVCVLSKVLG